MRTQEIYNVIETENDYRLSKEDELVFKSKHSINPPKMKKILYGVEIMKPMSYTFIEDLYSTSRGWIFEDMRGHWSSYVNIGCKKRAEHFKK